MKKKIFVTLLAVLMLALLPTAAFADTFVKSPSTAPAPKLEDFEPTDPDADGEIILTPFPERDTLPEKERDDMDEAYDSIKEASDVTDLSDELADIAKEKGIDPEDMAVSDLFDLRSTYPETEEVTVTLSSDNFEEFVALMVYTESGWQIVKDASVNGRILTFKSDAFCPFAVVVKTAVPDSPQTGAMIPWMLLTGALVSGVVGAGIMFIGRKKEIGA